MSERVHRFRQTAQFKHWSPVSRNRHSPSPVYFTLPAGLGTYIVGTVAATFLFSPNLAAGIGSYVVTGVTARFNLNLNRWTAISSPSSTWTPEQ